MTTFIQRRELNSLHYYITDVFPSRDYKHGRRDSVAGTVARLLTGQFGVRLPVKLRHFSFLCNVQIDYSIVTEVTGRGKATEARI
jgi:hypothetical protein